MSQEQVNTLVGLGFSVATLSMLGIVVGATASIAEQATRKRKAKKLIDGTRKKRVSPHKTSIDDFQRFLYGDR